MSLKAFHLLFISLSIVGAVAFGMWGVTSYRTDGAMFPLAAAVGSFGGAIGLGVYEAAFVRKCRRIGV